MCSTGIKVTEIIYTGARNVVVVCEDTDNGGEDTDNEVGKKLRQPVKTPIF